MRAPAARQPGTPEHAGIPAPAGASGLPGRSVPPPPLPGAEPVEVAPSETAGRSVALDALPPGRRAVLSTLKQRGEASADEIAAVLGLTAGAVRQHLGPLEDQGLIAHRDERTGPGRPRRRYCLTPATEVLWPKRYGQLTNQLLAFISDSDPSLVDLAFEGRRRARVERAATRLEGRSFAGRVAQLAAILDEDGYLASCEDLGDGRWQVVEHNCAILDVAQRYGQACASELAFLREALPGAEVERTAHMMAGAHVCAYEIRGPVDDAPGAGAPPRRPPSGRRAPQPAGSP